MLSAISDMILAVGAVAAGLWAVYSYRQARRAEIARWTKSIFSEFFLDKQFDRIRDLLEYNFEHRLEALAEISVHGVIDIDKQEDRDILRELDNFLNYIEFMLYLRDHNRINLDDLNAIFGYWIDLLRDDRHAVIRRYALKFGFERVADLVCGKADEHLVLYGTLRSGEPDFLSLNLADALEYVSPCSFRADLYNLGEYPGAVLGEGTVHGDLFRVRDNRIFRTTDDHEEYDSRNPDLSLYRRRCVTLLDPMVDAWVYFYNKELVDAAPIPDGRWRPKQPS